MATGNAVFLSTTGGSAFPVKKSIILIHTSTCNKLRLIRPSTYHSTYNLVTPSFQKLVSFSTDAQTEGNMDSDNGVCSSTTETNDAFVVETGSAVIDSLSVYKEALANNDDAKIAEVESFLKSIENEKIELEKKLEILLEELSNKKAGILTISAQFNDFRKRAETERMSLVSDARGQVLESLLPVVDEFERVTTEINVEKEGEERINNSYLSIYKQFVEILGSLRVDPVENIGEPSDTMVSTQIDSKFNRAIDEFRQKLNRVYLNFTKTWIRF